VPESIDVNLKRAAVALADELDYARAAEKLNIDSTDLKKQVFELEKTLCLHIFRRRQKRVELTKDGTFLIRVFREAVALHDRVDGSADKT
jgi:DNA-binding transcriptional LysR family regulator